jgi:3-methyladenine DNA glycosylase AlkD
MATVESVLAELKALGSEKTAATYVRHGMPAGRVYGVSVANLKVVAKSIKRQQALAMELYATGIMDAMYLAGMVADGSEMTVAQLEAWAEGSAGMNMIAEYTVPWVTVENVAAVELANRWIDSGKDHVASAGWATWSGLVSTKPDAELDRVAISELLEGIPRRIASAPNRTRAAMNSFVICVGSYVEPLLGKALEVAARLGKVPVDVGDTACKIPLASEYIAKVQGMGRVGLKKKTIRC